MSPRLTLHLVHGRGHRLRAEGERITTEARSPVCPVGHCCSLAYSLQVLRKEIWR